ncbi:MAG TPA: two-component sensor histidine kinase, partial [Desulfobacteria bacterium]|nr:two-component sensor histidine kinase [Desulfobacteria bacterium]
MNGTGRSSPRFIERFGGLLLMILAVALPVLYFVTGWEMESEHLRTETELYARQVSSLINRNPDMWKYETIRIDGLLAKPGDDPHTESLRILDLEGNIVTQRKERPAWPRMTRTHPLMDSGVVVGSLEESSSLRPL